MIENIEQAKKKEIAILKILSEANQPLGSRSITRQLNGQGIPLCERAVGYHLKMLDERGLTLLVSRTSGRLITRRGIEEITDGRVSDRLGYMGTKIEELAYQTTLELDTCSGEVPVDLVILYKVDLANAIKVLGTISKTDLLINELICIIEANQKIGPVVVPDGMVGIATISNVAIVGAFLNAGIFPDLLFSGVLQVRQRKAFRFTQLISHPGCTMHPGELFVVGKMLSVNEVALTGTGKVLADFFQFPALCQDTVKELLDRLINIGFNKPLNIGEAGEPVCEIPVSFSKVGIVLQNSLNFAAALSEKNIMVTCHAMCGILETSKMNHLKDLS
ncbi:MAG: NrpR regulatory domain-containing protein [Chloroflexi bacterium]|nr:NrpR regulatory domain-containing protein [Chloroflexota bacterium]